MEQYYEDYAAYMNLLQGGYNLLVGIIVLLGLGILAVLMFKYMPRTSQLSAKDEKIRQLRERISELSERAAQDALSDRQERTEIVADRDEREQSLIERYEKQIADARKERDLWRHRSRFAEKRAKVFAKMADHMSSPNSDTLTASREELKKELDILDEQMKAIDNEILEIMRAA